MKKSLTLPFDLLDRVTNALNPTDRMAMLRTSFDMMKRIALHHPLRTTLNFDTIDESSASSARAALALARRLPASHGITMCLKNLTRAHLQVLSPSETNAEASTEVPAVHTMVVTCSTLGSACLAISRIGPTNVHTVHMTVSAAHDKDQDQEAIPTIPTIPMPSVRKLTIVVSSDLTTNLHKDETFATLDKLFANVECLTLILDMDLNHAMKFLGAVVGRMNSIRELTISGRRKNSELDWAASAFLQTSNLPRLSKLSFILSDENDHDQFDYMGMIPDHIHERISALVIGHTNVPPLDIDWPKVDRHACASLARASAASQSPFKGIIVYGQQTNVDHLRIFWKYNYMPVHLDLFSDYYALKDPQFDQHQRAVGDLCEWLNKAKGACHCDVVEFSTGPEFNYSLELPVHQHLPQIVRCIASAPPATAAAADAWWTVAVDEDKLRLGQFDYEEDDDFSFTVNVVDDITRFLSNILNANEARPENIRLIFDSQAFVLYQCQYKPDDYEWVDTLADAIAASIPPFVRRLVFEMRHTVPGELMAYKLASNLCVRRDMGEISIKAFQVYHARNNSSSTPQKWDFDFMFDEQIRDDADVQLQPFAVLGHPYDQSSQEVDWSVTWWMRDWDYQRAT